MNVNIPAINFTISFPINFSNQLISQNNVINQLSAFLPMEILQNLTGSENRTITLYGQQALYFKNVIDSGVLGGITYSVTQPTTAFGNAGKVRINGNHLNSRDVQAINSLALQNNGKIVAGGSRTINSGTSTWVIRRFNIDGSLDSSFGTGGTVSFDWIAEGANGLAGCAKVLIQADGKIVCIGYFHFAHDGGGYNMAVARLNPNGSLDNSFGSGGKVTESFGTFHNFATSGFIQPDDKIVVAGNHALIGTAAQFTLIRYNIDGTLDSSFGSGGKVSATTPGYAYSFGEAAALQSDGKIVMSGFNNPSDFSFSNVAVMRFNPNGSLDNTFGTGGIVTTSFTNAQYSSSNAIAIQNDGKIVVGGISFRGSFVDYIIAKYNSDGSLDNTFGTGGKVERTFSQLDGGTYGLLVQPDNKIVLCGYADVDESGFSDYPLVLRFNADGSIDNTFGQNGFVITYFVQLTGQFSTFNTVAMQPDGKILAGGVDNFDNTFHFGDSILVRYNPNGSLDVGEF